MFLETKANNITNKFWKDVVLSFCDLRVGKIPVVDLDYLSWPLWQDQVINLPSIKKLQKNNVNMVSDLLDKTWEIMPKEEIERTKGVNLNFLEYLSIKQSIKQFIRNADKRRVNVGPYRPYMLNLVFSQKRDVKIFIEKPGSMKLKFFLRYPKNGK